MNGYMLFVNEIGTNYFPFWFLGMLFFFNVLILLRKKKTLFATLPFAILFYMVFAISTEMVELPTKTCFDITEHYQDKGNEDKYQKELKSKIEELKKHRESMVLALQFNASNYSNLIVQEQKIEEKIKELKIRLEKQNKVIKTEYMVLSNMGNKNYTVLKEDRSVVTKFEFPNKYSSDITLNLKKECSIKISAIAKEEALLVQER